MIEEQTTDERNLLEKTLHTCLNLSQAIRFQLELVADNQIEDLSVGIESARRTSIRLVDFLEKIAEEYSAMLDTEELEDGTTGDVPGDEQERGG